MKIIASVRHLIVCLGYGGIFVQHVYFLCLTWNLNICVPRVKDPLLLLIPLFLGITAPIAVIGGALYAGYSLCVN